MRTHEPLSNLDAKMREETRGELRDLVKRLGITTLYVTHDQLEALTMSDVVANRRSLTYGSAIIRRQFWEATMHAFILLGISVQFLDDQSTWQIVFRALLIILGEDSDRLSEACEICCRTPEEFKAWSQNLGHEDVLTTFRSYGAVGTRRQGEIIRELGLLITNQPLLCRRRD